jgi:tight adherence protein B
MVVLIIFLVFVVSFGLLLSALYFVVEVPAAKRRVRERLAALQQTSMTEADEDTERLIMRQELMSRIPAIDRLLLRLRWVTKLQLSIEQAGIKMPVASLVLMSLGIGLAGLLLGLLLPVPLPMVVMLAAAAAAAPFAVVALKRKQRFAKFAELFPDAVDLLSRAVRAGHAFTTGFALIGSEMPEPVAGEFRTVYSQQNLGLPLDDTLRNLTLRIPLTDVRIFVSALLIQRESGGNLAEILDNLSYVIRERFRILRQVDILSAEGRISMWVLMGAPIVGAVLLFLINPDYMGRLFSDPWGRIALGTAAGMQFIGYLIIRKIVRIEV